MAKFRKQDRPEAEDETAGAPQLTGDTTAAKPDRERLASRAYELYLARGGGEGRDVDDWLEAERELRPRDPERTGPER